MMKDVVVNGDKLFKENTSSQYVSTCCPKYLNDSLKAIERSLIKANGFAIPSTGCRFGKTVHKTYHYSEVLKPGITNFTFTGFLGRVNEYVGSLNTQLRKDFPNGKYLCIRQTPTVYFSEPTMKTAVNGDYIWPPKGDYIISVLCRASLVTDEDVKIEEDSP